MSSIVVGMTSADIAALSLATIADWQPSDVLALTADQIAAFTSAQIGALAAVVHAFSQAEIAGFDPIALARAAATVIAILKPSQITEMAAGEVGALGASQLAALDRAQVAAMTLTQIASLTPSAMLGLGVGKVSALSADQAGALTALQIIGMTRAQRAALSATNAAALSETVINSLSAPALQQLTGFTSAQVAGFSPATIAKLSVAQFDALIAPTIGSLSLGKIVRLTTAQLQSLTANEIASLTGAQLSAFLPGQFAAFSASQIGAIGAAAIAGMSTQTFDALLSTHLASLSAAAIAGVSIADLSSLTAAQLASFTATQVAAMSAAQLAIVNAGAISTNPILADAVAHETNGSLSFAGALAVLQDAAKTAMSTTVFAELTAVAKYLNASGGIAALASVQQLFDDVVLGNSANAHWNGGSNTATSLGNLSSNSTASQFSELIGKWFLGTDMPGTEIATNGQSYASAYEAYTLPLYVGGAPVMTDVAQGQVGDCWFLASLAETALQDPSLIKNMITTNSNGAFTVEFQVGGKADYVTVNNEFPTYSGSISQADGAKMEFANSNSDLWAPVIEKALAQLSEQSGVSTGLEYAGLGNQFLQLTAGNGEGVTFLTGQAIANDYLGNLSSGGQTALLGQLQLSLAAGNDVLLGTSDNNVSGNLVADHMFAVTSINAGTGSVGLFNPWGANSTDAGVAETFSVSVATLAADQAWFFAGTGARATA